MTTCHLCGEPSPATDHLRVMHPSEYGDGFETWPDGGVVLHDADPTPEDFA